MQYDHELQIKCDQRTHGWTREQVIKWYENMGRKDGEASAKYTTHPMHLRWIDEGHFNPDYERGYWKGYGVEQ